MNQNHHLSAVQIVIAAVYVTNLCLLVTAAFYRGRRPMKEFDSREKMGLTAVFFGLTSQVFYLLLPPWMFGWLFLDRDSVFHRLHIGFYSVGFLLSALSMFAGCFGRGMRRYVSLWVEVSTGFLWSWPACLFCSLRRERLGG